jgi:peptidoglycan/xylan/chitin deacetylase (PgdA/CDA1 family)
MFSSVPILYYHRVGAPDPIHLSIPAALFRRQMEFLARRGVETLSSERLMAFLTGRETLSRPAVLITFDDGFCDNRQVAGPILKDCGFQAILFMITSLIRPPNQLPIEKPRPFTLAHTAARRGDFGDFLAADELREMEQSGVFEVHSHSHEHQQVFLGNTATGLYPRDDDHWGILSAYGEAGKSERGKNEPVLPIFPRGPGLVHPGWFPREPAFFPFARTCPSPKGVVFPESLFHREQDADFRRRLLDDLTRSRDIMKSLRSRAVELLCWPWGATSETASETARAVGFSGAVLTRTGVNHPGTDPFALCRFPVKKPGMMRFILGYRLRAGVRLGRLYERWHGWF